MADEKKMDLDGDSYEETTVTDESGDGTYDTVTSDMDGDGLAEPMIPSQATWTVTAWTMPSLQTQAEMKS